MMRFFETSWFALLSVLAGLVVVAAVVWLRGARLRAGRAALERMVEERTATIALQAERLRELDRLKSQFFTNVSHEFRTPLTLILGPLEDARAGRSGPLGERLAHDLEVAEKNARRLLGLVDQLLDVTRLDTGRLDLKVRKSDLSFHLSRRVEAFLPLAERRSTVLELVIPDGPVELYFDEVQLEKVFDNLIGNALKFTPEGGHVRVVLRVADGAGAQVTVEDDGPGIPADHLPRIFDRFYQVDATARRRFSGTGIGLALARQIVELHGGIIAVDSSEGQGTRFTVTLKLGGEHLPPEVMAGRIPTGEMLPEDMPSFPALAEAALWETDPPPAAEEPAPDDDRTTILVVDDNAGIRGYVRRQLEGDYRVLEAVDGLDGLEQARRFTPDLIVSDVMMPGLDGHSLFRTLREDPDLSFVPFVLLTAKASAENRLQGLEDGVDDYLVKPFDPRELKARVDNLIAARKRLRERLAAEPRPLQVSPVEITPADEAFLNRVQAIVEERLADTELSVEALAKALHCDRSYLLRKLRALTGETPSELIRSLRLQRAEQLLAAAAGTVGEIAYSVGFKSVAHFSNAFHERCGERPSSYMARHRAGRP